MTLSFEQVESGISTWTREKKVQLLSTISKNLEETSSSGIVKTTGVCGGRACIVGTRIPVWTLVEIQKMGLSDAEILTHYPHLHQQDLDNAWSYYKANSKEIDFDIQENDNP
jgi:uncharacterized protein (DUF433 family)